MYAKEGRWRRIGHDTLHFNVGKYRRLLNADARMQDAKFFDHNNKVRGVRLG